MSEKSLSNNVILPHDNAQTGGYISKSHKSCLGGFLVEFILTVPVIAVVVLGTINVSVVLREANIITEAARHGARSAAANAGIIRRSGVARTTFASSTFHTCSDTVVDPGVGNACVDTAIAATCNYLSLNRLVPSEWQVRGQIVKTTNTLPDGDGTPLWVIKVEIQPLDNRSIEPFIAGWLDLRPKAESIFPHE